MLQEIYKSRLNKMGDSVRQINITADSDLLKKVKIDCIERGIPLRSAVESALRDYLAKKTARRRMATSIADPAADASKIINEIDGKING